MNKTYLFFVCGVQVYCWYINIGNSMFGWAVGEYLQKQSMTLATIWLQSGYNLATIQLIIAIKQGLI
jgi:hypothetical protein